MKGLGSNCFRFSFEWGRLEPSRACWDESAFQRYSEILECLEVRARLSLREGGRLQSADSWAEAWHQMGG